MSQDSELIRTTVLGGGAWGTALALHCARKGHDVVLWAREQDVVDGINQHHENSLFFKGFILPEKLRATTDILEATKHGKLILMVIPTPFVASVMAQISGAISEDQTLETPDKILKRVLPSNLHSRLAFLSGPSFAAEVAKENPTAVTIASENEGVRVAVQELMSSPRFRCYTTNDVAGVELGGALKNVLAIACGISDGLGFGSNGRAALITRGLDELSRLAVRCGANPLTLAGLSGVGDLILTCTGDLSRNRTVGMRLGKGETLEEVMKSMSAVAEGVLTSKSAHNLAKKMGVDCPVIEGIYKVIHLGENPLDVLASNMTRPLKPEVSPIVADAWQRN
eukprot:jgi/Picsp_1/5512/NSC_02871-R1_nad h-dependent glycerol-3-phosphate dehydrogenase